MVINHEQTHTECFVDVDWVGCKTNKQSTTGYCVFLGGNLVSWRSKKQGVVSQSSTESGYRALALSICEIIWIRHILTEIGLRHSTPVKL